MVGGRSKVSTFKELQERVSKRVMGWKEKNISKAGRKFLIKSAAQAIPTYFISIFKIPRAVCDGMNLTLAKYWWGRLGTSGRYTGSTGVGCALRRIEVEWGFETFMLLISQCWLSRHGGWLRRLTPCFTECTRLGISPRAPSWRRCWETIPLLSGTSFSVQGMWLQKGQYKVLEMEAWLALRAIGGSLTPRLFMLAWTCH